MSGEKPAGFSTTASLAALLAGANYAEAQVAEPEVRHVPVPVSRAAVLGAEVPAAATVDAVRAAFRTRWVLRWGFRVVLLSVPV